MILPSLSLGRHTLSCPAHYNTAVFPPFLFLTGPHPPPFPSFGPNHRTSPAVATSAQPPSRPSPAARLLPPPAAAASNSPPRGTRRGAPRLPPRLGTPPRRAVPSCEPVSALRDDSPPQKAKVHSAHLAPVGRTPAALPPRRSSKRSRACGVASPRRATQYARTRLPCYLSCSPVSPAMDAPHRDSIPSANDVISPSSLYKLDAWQTARPHPSPSSPRRAPSTTNSNYSPPSSLSFPLTPPHDSSRVKLLSLFPLLTLLLRVPLAHPHPFLQAEAIGIELPSSAATALCLALLPARPGHPSRSRTI